MKIGLAAEMRTRVRIIIERESGMQGHSLPKLFTLCHALIGGA